MIVYTSCLNYLGELSLFSRMLFSLMTEEVCTWMENTGSDKKKIWLVLSISATEVFLFRRLDIFVHSFYFICFCACLLPSHYFFPLSFMTLSSYYIVPICCLSDEWSSLFMCFLIQFVQSPISRYFDCPWVLE